MIVEIKKADVGASATKNNEQKESYQSPRPRSRLKTEIGELLLCLASSNTQSDGWQQFEQLLAERWAV